MDSPGGCVTQVMSFWGSRPTYAAMLEMKACWLEASSSTPTVLPFKSRIVRTRSVPKSSKHPEWPPARMTTGSPASISMRSRALKCMFILASPDASAVSIPLTPGFLMYSRSVKPSVRKNASATNWAAWQMVGA